MNKNMLAFLITVRVESNVALAFEFALSATTGGRRRARLGPRRRNGYGGQRLRFGTAQIDAASLILGNLERRERTDLGAWQVVAINRIIDYVKYGARGCVVDLD